MASIRVPRPAATDFVAGRTYVNNIRGLDEVLSLLNEFSEKAPDACETAMRGVALRIKDSAKSSIHSISGQLAGSLRIRNIFNPKTRRVVITAGGSKAPHAHLVEFGHKLLSHSGEYLKGVEERPFLRPAFETHIPVLVAQMEEAINRLIP